ncbi:MAG: DNA-3-methyladenine glycosylase [Vitreimonas sp.]
MSRARMPASPIELARYLIGKTLMRRLQGAILAGRIVETEAYLPEDPASHSFRGMTARNASMFRVRGHAYVYRIYGMYWCLNVSAGTEHEGAAVLIRAVEPLASLDTMRALRGMDDVKNLARGPGRLCQAFAIDDTFDGMDLTQPGRLYLAPATRARGELGESTRIGLTKASESVLRFYERGSGFLSGVARLNA